MLTKIKKFFGIHEHERKLFLIGKHCFVMCTTCGAESIPWEPPLLAVEAAREHHSRDDELYANIKNRIERKDAY